MHRIRALIMAFAALCGVSTVLLAEGASPEPASAATGVTYTPGTPSVATITNGTSAAPWNEYQGDSASPAYASQSPGTVLPTYTPGGASTGSGATAEPNLAVFPGATSGTDGNSPYPAGTVGTPGTLDGYCGTGSQVQESAGSPVRQPTGTTLPLAPAYFPHIVRNADGTLTGYFDYRPKDADEAIVAATSTDNGKDWTYDGEALEENPGYCPSADINDDGEGHPNVITIGGNTYLYTLPRAAGDMQGVGMVVHQFTPTESNPLGTLPATEKVGIDPDAFVPTGTAAMSVTNGTPQSIPLTTLGTAGSPEQLVVGSFVDLTQTPGIPTVITCTGLGTSSLTGCTTASGTSVNVQAGDLIEQVLGFTTPSSDVGLVIPPGPNTTNGDGGLSSFTLDSTSGNPGFASPLTGSTFNNNAPNRIYVNGVATYCSQSNANPTTHIEDCTTGPGGSTLTLTSLEAVTGDPIVPATADNVGGGDGMTNGLVAPDGIVGTLPSYPNDGSVPSGATYVMYTEKELSYYIAGDTLAKGTFSSTTGTSITSTPGTYISEDLPAPGPYDVQIGATEPTNQGSATAIIPVTCTSVNETTGTFSGCTTTSTFNGWTWASNTYIAAPGATTVSPTTLAETGEGSATNVAKLYKNNEDLTVLRVAWTTNGTTFSDVGLTNSGVISGENNCSTGNTACISTTSYDDINNPSTNVSPSNLDAYAENDAANGTGPSAGGTDTGGTSDLDEMRWVGSAGTIIVNPDGTYGLFLSGAWAADGDSDSFNQIFYATSTNGEYWSVPTPVVSTDYSFAASVTQDSELAGGQDDPLGISGYYSGRAYAPSVVQNPDGTLTMVFGGDRLPKSIAAAGSVLGTNSSAQYTIGSTDPALYRNILVVTLTSMSSVPTSTTVSSSVTTSTGTADAVTYSATVAPVSPGTGTPTGTVSFATSSGPISGCTAVPLDEDSPDVATCASTYAGSIDNEIQATYSGDSNYVTSSSTPLSTTTITSSDTGTGVVGETVTYSATVAAVSGPAPSGGVSFTDSAGVITNCSDQSLTLVGSNEVSTCSTNYAAPTADTVIAAYLGDESTLGSSSTFNESIGQASTTVAVTPQDGLAGAVVGQPVTYVATVGVVSPGSGTPTGSITFSSTSASGPITGCSNVAVSQGSPDTATCTTSYAGTTTDNVTATYSGDTNFTGSVSLPFVETLSQASTTTTIASSDSGSGSVVGQPVTFSATVTVNAPGSGTPSSTVAFSDADGLLTTCGDQALSTVDGAFVATCTFAFPQALPAGDLITATYAGDANFTSSSSSLNETILPASTTTTLTSSDGGAGVVVGQPVTYTASVSVNEPGAGTPSGTVTFYGSGGVAIPGCTSVALSDGVGDTASCATTYATVTSATVDAKYSGDANFSSSTSSSITENVGQDTTTLELAALPDPAITGQPETISASVLVNSPGVGVPSGTVSFFDGSTALCSAVALNAAGQATCSATYAKISGSPHALTATYSGGVIDLPATSNTVSLSVTQATSLKVTASPSPAPYGHSIVLDGKGLPSKATGTVSFSSSGTLLCQATVAKGAAECDVPTALAPGSYSILGQYSGDSTYAPSSASVGLTVTQASTAIGAKAIPASVPYGTALTLEATRLPQGVTGTVSFKSSTTVLCDVPATSPDVVCAIPSGRAVGTYQVSVTYSGDANFVGSSANTSFIVRQAHTQFVASATPASVSASQNVTLKASGLPTSSTGTVSFSSGGSTLCSATVSAGAVSCAAPSGLAAGTHHVTAKYSGDANYLASNASTVFVVTRSSGG